MALVVNATVGDASANSYVTLAEATAYMESRLNGSAWMTATEDSQNRALVEATRELTPLDWSGTRVTDTQALSWPRRYATNPDSTYFGTQWYDEAVVPQRVKDATCELAFQFLKAGTTDIAALDPTTGVIEKTVDVLTTRWADPYSRPTGLALYPRVLALIGVLLCGSAQSSPILKG